VTAPSVSDHRAINAVSIHELQRRWQAVRSRMGERGIDALVIQNSSDWVGGYIRWFSNHPATNLYLSSLVFPDDSFGIEVGPKHELAKRRSLTLSELRDYPWVLPGPGSAYRRHVDALFLSAGVPWPQNSIFSSSLPLVESIVARTNRVTVVTRLQATMHNFWRLRAIPLRGGGHRTLCIAWRRAGQLSEQAARLAQMAHELAVIYQAAERRTARH
jgi:DNA-binding transcriptional LysR family regulator